MATSNSSTRGCNRIDLTGQTFGRWQVLCFHSIDKRRKALWLCRCECGTVRAVFGMSLRARKSKSCGCAVRRQGGGCYTAEYRTWRAMKRRCLDKAFQDYRNYGGRGIIVCDRWKQSFPAFLEDMGPRPFPKATIERINNDGPYSPENCRWASKQEQAQNTRRSRMLTYNGETLSVTNWARRLSVPPYLLFERLRRGWSVEKTLSH